jgi:hypothetical protein
MATANILFGLPEDKDSDRIYIWSSSTENGTYTQIESLAYLYAGRAIEYTNLDVTKWYKIQFANTETGTFGPLSDPIYGGDFDNSKPFIALSTSFDGNSYSTTTDLFESSNLTTTDITLAKARAALRTARAYIDLILGESDLHRFSRAYSTDVSRRKYNAYLEILKKAEVGYALALIYKDLADDQIMKNIRDQKKSFDNISIGQTSLSPDSTKNYTQIAEFLDSQGQRYNAQASAMLATLLPTSIPLIYNGELKVRMTDVWAFNGPITSEGSAANVELATESLTGDGVAMNNAWVDLTAILLTTSSIIEDTSILVNGVQYPLDSWIDSAGTTHGSGTSGFSLDIQGVPHKVRWNHTTANGGFDLTNLDEVYLKYWS